VRIGDDVGLLRGWANHEDARWGKGGNCYIMGR